MVSRKDIAVKVAETHNMSIKQASGILSSILDIVVESVSKKEVVQIVGFGQWKAVHKKAKKARNPRSGAEIMVPQHYSAKFVPGSKLVSGAKSIKK